MEKEIEVETEGPVEKSCIKRLLKKCPLDFALIKNAKFQLFALTTAINWGSIFLVHLLIVDFAEDRGFTLAEGAGLLTLLGIAALVSRFLVALLKMIKSVKNIIWYIGFALIASFIHACIPLTNSYRSLLVTVGLLGIVFGCRFSFFVLSLLEMVPVQKYPQALGYCLSLWGLAVMITGPIVGQVTTLKGSYDFSYIMGGMVAACSLIPLTVYVIRNKGQFNFYNKQNSDSN